MLIALALLLAALILVLIKDCDFWFPPNLAQRNRNRNQSKSLRPT